MKKNEYEISVVVPCYNSEKFIGKSLDLICNQSFKNYEVICVDDGSTDNTSLEIMKYMKKYKFLKYIKKENDKSKTTILVGLKHAVGKYICVVDNDDFITTDYLEVLYNRIIKDDADIAVCGYQRVELNSGKVLSTEMNKRNDCLIIDNNYEELLTINTSLWNKMIKSDLIIPYTKEKGLFSMDMLYMAYVYAKAKKIVFTKKVMYFYQVSPSSSINNMQLSYLEDIQNALLVIKKYYKKTNDKMLDFLSTYVFLHIGVSLTFRFYGSKNFNLAYKSNRDYLKKNFNNWYKSRYLKFFYILKNRGINLKLFICKVFYRLNLFKVFLFFYNLFLNKMKIEIKW